MGSHWWDPTFSIRKLIRLGGIWGGLVSRFGDAEELALKEQVAHAFNNFTAALVFKYRRTAEEAVLGKALDFARRAVRLGKGRCNLSCALALSGKLDETFDELEGCLERQEIEWFHVDGDRESNRKPDSDWDNLRDHPRYLALRAKYGKKEGDSEDKKHE